MNPKISLKLMLVGVATFGSLGAPQVAIGQATASNMKAPPALETVIAESHEALREILNGDPSGYAALFANRDDITLGNPFGPFGKGREGAKLPLRSGALAATYGGTHCAISTSPVLIARPLDVFFALPLTRLTPCT